MPYQPLHDDVPQVGGLVPLIQDLAVLAVVSSYLLDLPALKQVLCELDGTNEVFLRELDRMAELARIAGDVETLVKDALTAVNRQAHSGDGRILAAVRAIVHNLHDSLARMPLNSVEVISVLGPLALHGLLRETHRTQGHAHALPLGAVLRTLAGILADSEVVSQDSPISEQTQRELRAVNHLIGLQKILHLAEDKLVHSVHATAQLLASQVMIAQPLAQQLHYMLQASRPTAECVLQGLGRSHLGAVFLRRGLWIRQRIPADLRRHPVRQSAGKLLPPRSCASIPSPPMTDLPPNISS